MPSPDSMGSQRFPPSARLRKRGDFLPVVRRGRVYAGEQCVVRVLRREDAARRLGVAAPRKYGCGVRRNRFRRLVREAFRLAGTGLDGCDFLVAPRRGLVEPTLAGIGADLIAARGIARGERRRGRGERR